LRDGVYSSRGARRRNDWEMPRKFPADRRARVKIYAMSFRQTPPNRARNNIARGKLLARDIVHEPRTRLVDQSGSLTTHRLGDQGERVATGAERRRMELHKLHVDEGRSCTSSERQSLTD